MSLFETLGSTIAWLFSPTVPPFMSPKPKGFGRYYQDETTQSVSQTNGIIERVQKRHARRVLSRRYPQEDLRSIAKLRPASAAGFKPATRSSPARGDDALAKRQCKSSLTPSLSPRSK
jgi:hypothetical protein